MPLLRHVACTVSCRLKHSVAVYASVVGLLAICISDMAWNKNVRPLVVLTECHDDDLLLNSRMPFSIRRYCRRFNLSPIDGGTVQTTKNERTVCSIKTQHSRYRYSWVFFTWCGVCQVRHKIFFFLEHRSHENTPFGHFLMWRSTPHQESTPHQGKNTPHQEKTYAASGCGNARTHIWRRLEVTRGHTMNGGWGIKGRSQVTETVTG